MPEKIHGCRTTLHAYPDIYAYNAINSHLGGSLKEQTWPLGGKKIQMCLLRPVTNPTKF